LSWNFELTANEVKMKYMSLEIWNFELTA